MKKVLTLLMIVFLTSCGESKEKNFTIIKEVPNKALKKVNIDIRLNGKISELELKKIAIELKEERSEYNMLWIFYYLPENKIGNGAWATSHYSPLLEVKILGATKKASKELKAKKVTGKIIKTWKDNDAIMPNKIFLVKENSKLYMKTLYAKNSLADAFELIEEVTKSEKKGIVRFDYDNTHGEYFIIEKNGNLGLYDDSGKFKEAIKEE